MSLKVEMVLKGVKVCLPEDRVCLNCVISVISIVLRETLLTISVSTGEPLSIEFGIVTVVSLNTTEISEITRMKIRSPRSGYLIGYNNTNDDDTI